MTVSRTRRNALNTPSHRPVTQTPTHPTPTRSNSETAEALRTREEFITFVEMSVTLGVQVWREAVEGLEMFAENHAASTEVLFLSKMWCITSRNCFVSSKIITKRNRLTFMSSQVSYLQIQNGI